MQVIAGTARSMGVEADVLPMTQHGKAYRQARAKFDRETEYSPVQAIRLLKEFETAKFDETVEVHFRTSA